MLCTWILSLKIFYAKTQIIIKYAILVVRSFISIYQNLCRNIQCPHLFSYLCLGLGLGLLDILLLKYSQVGPKLARIPAMFGHQELLYTKLCIESIHSISMLLAECRALISEITWKGNLVLTTLKYRAGILFSSLKKCQSHSRQQESVGTKLNKS